MKIDYLEWDSNFFGFSVGKIIIDNQTDLSQLIKLLQKSSFKIIYIFAQKPSSKRIGELSQFSWLFDTKLVYKKQQLTTRALSETISRHTGELSEDLRSLAIMSGQFSRFKADPNFKPWFENLYITWIRKSISGEIADAVFTVKNGNAIIGFISLIKRQLSGQIGLIAVDSQYRNKGYASSLLNCAESWFNKNRCKEISVVTQKENKAACRLYEKCGFALHNETAIFHYWNSLCPHGGMGIDLKTAEKSC